MAEFPPILPRLPRVRIRANEPRSRPPRERDYAREYQRRNELAKQRGFKSYGQQRHYTETTGERARDITYIDPGAIAEIYVPGGYDYADYEEGTDQILDAWIRRSRGQGVEDEEAYLIYMRRSRGGRLTRNQVRRLARQEYGLDWNERWESS